MDMRFGGRTQDPRCEKADFGAIPKKLAWRPVSRSKIGASWSQVTPERSPCARHSPQTFRPIRTTTRSRRCGSGAACLWDVRVAGVYGIGWLSEPPRCPGTWPPPQTSGADVLLPFEIASADASIAREAGFGRTAALARIGRLHARACTRRVPPNAGVRHCRFNGGSRREATVQCVCLCTAEILCALRPEGDVPRALTRSCPAAPLPQR
jgi:hypothetical protein